MQCRFAHSKSENIRQCSQRIENRLWLSAQKLDSLASQCAAKLVSGTPLYVCSSLRSSLRASFLYPNLPLLSVPSLCPFRYFIFISATHGRLRTYIKLVQRLNTAGGILYPMPCGPRALPPAFLYLRACRKVSCLYKGLSTLSQAPS